MKKLYSITIIISVALICSFAGCSKPTDELANQPPVANAGEDLVLTLPIEAVMLDACDSYDPDGAIWGFQWTKLSGPECQLRDCEDMRATISDLKEGTYVFKLIVVDNQRATGEDVVEIQLKP